MTAQLTVPSSIGLKLRHEILPNGMVHYDIGDSICDMHYGKPDSDWDDNPIEVISVTEVECDNAEQVLYLLLQNVDESEAAKFYTNKIAIVVGHTLQGNYQAAWAYDGSYFGLMTFSATENPWRKQYRLGNIPLEA